MSVKKNIAIATAELLGLDPKRVIELRITRDGFSGYQYRVDSNGEFIGIKPFAESFDKDK